MSVFIFCVVGDLSTLIKVDSQEATIINSCFPKEETIKKQIILSL